MKNQSISNPTKMKHTKNLPYRKSSRSSPVPKLPIWYAKPEKVDYRKHGLFKKEEDKLYCPPKDKTKKKKKKRSIN